jgi:hypothetical protein
MARGTRKSKKVSRSKRPFKSLADMFPITETDPPVEPLKITRRPGFRRVAFR